VAFSLDALANQYVPGHPAAFVSGAACVGPDDEDEDEECDVDALMICDTAFWCVFDARFRLRVTSKTMSGKRVFFYFLCDGLYTVNRNAMHAAREYEGP
jgi:hypothetical protein